MFSVSGNLASMACGVPYAVAAALACGVMRQALPAPGPAVVEAVVDQNEPPMPPKVTVKQTVHLAEGLARGTPAAGKNALTIASDTVRELV
jgi:pyruvate dehydrogenase (quinone)